MSAVWRSRDPQRAMRLLLQELTHRVDGEFSAAIRILSSAAALTHSDETRRTLVAVQARLENFARVHHVLQAPEIQTDVDGCSYLQQLCVAISLSKLECLGIKLEVLDRECPIDSEQCWRLGIIVAELVAIDARRAFVSFPGADFGRDPSSAILPWGAQSTCARSWFSHRGRKQECRARQTRRAREGGWHVKHEGAYDLRSRLQLHFGGPTLSQVRTTATGSL